MTRLIRLLRSPLVVLLAIGVALLVLMSRPEVRAAAPDSADPDEPAKSEEHVSLHDFEARRLGGEVEPLSRYRGRVLLVVNTASRCGNTPQYEALQRLYREERERGLTILGFPSNDFGRQEPGTDAEIGAFCKENYGVEFPMFSKVVVKGPDAHPVYAFLTSRPAPVGGLVQWNFQKYLVDRGGRVVMRFDPKVQPDAPELRAELERLLAEPAPG